MLFDLDGTLVETNIDFTAMRAAAVDYCASGGADAGSLKGLDILAAIDRAAGSLPSAQREAFRRGGWNLLEEIELGYVGRARPREHAPELLRSLAARGYRLGVVTRNCRRAVDELLTLLPDVFGVCLAREDVPRAKPDPLHLRMALENLGVQASLALMVGDHPMDIQTGARAGAHTAGLLWGRPESWFQAALPDLLLQNLTELENALLGSHS